MKKHNENNERIKRKYLMFLKQAKGHDESTIDVVAKALSRFEQYNNYKDFKAFHVQQAVSFKAFLAKEKNKKTGKPLSKSTLKSTLNQLKDFFQWLSRETGYKSKINYSDAEFFNLSEKDKSIASAKRPKLIATLEQAKHTLSVMPESNDIEKRNKALFAFTLMTGSRVGAIISFKIKDIDLKANSVLQDARTVKTKFSKTFTTSYFPVGDEVYKVFHQWFEYITKDLLFGLDEPLFPKTKMINGEDNDFKNAGLSKEHWNTSAPVNRIFKDAFALAGLSYFNPHSFRDTLSVLGQKVCESPEEMKAWSQSLGHSQVMTTLFSYGDVQQSRQSEIFEGLRKPKATKEQGVSELAKAIAREMKEQESG
jgi:site-specific recombinase XerD